MSRMRSLKQPRAITRLFFWGGMVEELIYLR
jgi:hypothetical protein